MESIQNVPQGSVLITPTEMYREIQEIGKKVDHLSTVMDPALNNLREDVVQVRSDLATAVAERRAEVVKIDSRVRVLENWRWFVLGIATIISPAITILVNLVILKK